MSENDVIDELKEQPEALKEDSETSEISETNEGDSISVVLEDYPDTPEETSTEVGYDSSASAVPTDMSLGVSVVFVLSMILGALLFSILSRRWYV
jgi:hypothetical protein